MLFVTNSASLRDDSMRDVHESRQQQMERNGLPRGRQFSLTSIREAQRTVVRACGRLVLGHGAEEALWTSHLDEATATHVALDLSCVKDVDARGLGVLAALVRRARQRGTTLSVIAASRALQRLVEITRLDNALPGAWNTRPGVLSRPGVRARRTIPHTSVCDSVNRRCESSAAA
jgi:anti-anti-sigma factor